MPTDQTFWCTTCQGYKQAWNDYPNRCWTCDKYTLQRNAVITQSTSSTAISTSYEQRRQLAHEVAGYARETGQTMGYKLKVKDEQGRSVSQTIIAKPPKK